MRKINKEIVFITDPWDKENEFSLKRKNIEGNSKKIALEIMAVLKSISDRVVMYNDPKEFSNNICQHLDSVVLSTYYGTASPNSKSLIPSLCETNKIPFVGADSYTQMLCNDKYLSKKYITDFNLKTPRGILVRRSDWFELELINTLKLPLVIKPNFGGGSNGISNNNLVSTYQDAKNLTLQLIEYQNLPVLIEEYIPGYEVELVIFGNNKKIILEKEIGIEVDGVDYFQEQIWGYEAKKAGLHENRLRPTSYLLPEDSKKIHKLFCSFEKAEIMRIDCRIFENNAYILELSPDCYLGKTGGVYKSFESFDINYSEMFLLLIENSLK